MNRFKLTFVVVLATLGLTFLSCDDDDNYSLGDIAIDWATVVSVDPHTYYLQSDTWGSLWPAATSIPAYKPVDGQRVIAVFNPLYDDFQGFDLAIKVEEIDEVLTKDVEILTTENDEAFGNDPLYIHEGGIWVSGNHLNVAFLQNLPVREKHRISLVTSAMEPDAQGYVALELRYNNFDDVTGIGRNSYVSFDLRPLMQTEGVKGITLKCNLEETGEHLSTFDF